MCEPITSGRGGKLHLLPVLWGAFPLNGLLSFVMGEHGCL